MGGEIPWGVDEIDGIVEAAVLLEWAFGGGVSHSIYNNMMVWSVWSAEDILFAVFSPIVGLFSAGFDGSFVSVYLVDVLVDLLYHGLLLVESLKYIVVDLFYNFHLLQFAGDGLIVLESVLVHLLSQFLLDFSS